MQSRSMSAGRLPSAAVAEGAAVALDDRRDAILQVHPSRHCNLSCRHCYSASGPHRKGTIGIEALSALFGDAVAEGYGILSLSGGEPLMDSQLFEQIAEARRNGLRVNLVSNGTLADDARRSGWPGWSISWRSASMDHPRFMMPCGAARPPSRGPSPAHARCAVPESGSASFTPHGSRRFATSDGSWISHAGKKRRCFSFTRWSRSVARSD